MADFKTALNLTLLSEGGYSNDPDDLGSETAFGVSRKNFPKWEGWVNVDLAKRQSNFPNNLSQDTDLKSKVDLFYLVNFWNKIHGDEINNQNVATSIFDFAVNAGVGTSSSLAQMVSVSTVDGVIGKNTIEAINKTDTDLFLASFSLAKIARYINIVKKRPTSRKYFFGWVCRVLEGGIK